MLAQRLNRSCRRRSESARCDRSARRPLPAKSRCTSSSDSCRPGRAPLAAMTSPFGSTRAGPPAELLIAVPLLDDLPVHVDDDGRLRGERRQDGEPAPGARRVVDRRAGGKDRRAGMAQCGQEDDGKGCQGKHSSHVAPILPLQPCRRFEECLSGVVPPGVRAPSVRTVNWASRTVGSTRAINDPGPLTSGRRASAARRLSRSSTVSRSLSLVASSDRRASSSCRLDLNASAAAATALICSDCSGCRRSPSSRRRRSGRPALTFSSHWRRSVSPRSLRRGNG